METKIKRRRINQLIYIEYENPKPNGHRFTLMDSWRNKLGQIHEKFDELKNEFEYSFIDAQGNLLFKSGQLQKLKDEISKHKGVMMEKAHRIRKDRMMLRCSKGKEPIQREDSNSPKKFAENPPKYYRGQTEINPEELEKRHQEWLREQELRELREHKLNEQTRDLGR